MRKASNDRNVPRAYQHRRKGNAPRNPRRRLRILYASLLTFILSAACALSPTQDARPSRSAAGSARDPSAPGSARTNTPISSRLQRAGAFLSQRRCGRSSWTSSPDSASALRSSARMGSRSRRPPWSCDSRPTPHAPAPPLGFHFSLFTFPYSLSASRFSLFTFHFSLFSCPSWSSFRASARKLRCTAVCWNEFFQDRFR